MSNDSSKLPDEAVKKSIPWNPVVAIIAVIGLYFVTQVLAALIVSIYPRAMGWSHAHAVDWLTNDVTGQFFYVLAAEALTIGGVLGIVRLCKARVAAIGIKVPSMGGLALGVLVYPLYFITLAIAVALTGHFTHVNVNQSQEIGFTHVYGSVPLLLTFISLVILPPLTEEILVRGFLFSSLRSRMNFLPAAFLTSLLFAVAHLPEGGSDGPLYIAAIDTFILSMYLCYLRAKTGTIWAGVVLHAIKNGVAFVSLFILASR